MNECLEASHLLETYAQKQTTFVGDGGRREREELRLRHVDVRGLRGTPVVWLLATGLRIWSPEKGLGKNLGLGDTGI